MTPREIEFLNWLENNDPFIYDVVKEKLTTQGINLGSWGSVLGAVGKAVVTIAPAYIGYKQSKDQAKLQKLQLQYQAQAQAAPVAVAPVAIKNAATSSVTKNPAAPSPNVSAVNEILKRIQLAIQNQPQPVTGDYVPFVQPTQLVNYPQAVKATSKNVNMPLYIGLGLSAALLIVLKLRG